MRENTNYSSAQTWLDYVFANNDSSLAGWQYQLTMPADSLNRVGYCDRVISIYENNNDPYIDLEDSLTTGHDKLWAKNLYYWAKEVKFAIENDAIIK